MKRDCRQKKIKVTMNYDEDAKVEISEKNTWMGCQFKGEQK